MKNVIAAFITIVIISCQIDNVNKLERTLLEKAVVNPYLIYHLDSLIETTDNLVKVNPRYSKHYSYWIHISENEEKCYLRLMANFNFYQKKETEGFLNYRDKIITFYNTRSNCNNGIVNPSNFKKNTEEIETLDSYEDIDVPPHDPTFVLFEIGKDGKLIKI